MADTIGRIAVPSVIATDVFPLRTDFAHSRARKRQVITHRFAANGGKTEQAFYMGPPTQRYTFQRAALNMNDVSLLKTFWEAQQGAFEAFLYDVFYEDQTTERKTVCFENTPLSLEELANAARVGLTFVEIPDPSTAPIYTSSSIVERFPDTILGTALLDQVQEIIPLVHIRVLDSDVPDIYLSDRRCTVDANLYLPRLLRIGEPGSDVLISQSIDGSSDDVSFALGNADRVMVQVANDTELKKATIELSLFHVGSGVQDNIWSGEITDWASDEGPEFQVRAADIIEALTLQSPVRNISRTCWRIYANSAFGCPIDKDVDTRDLVHFPNADMSTCDLGYDTTNGCLAHVAAIKSFGGAQVDPQQVKILDDSTGTVFGFGRDLITPTSMINDSIWGATLPEIWHNDDGIPQRGLPVQCRIASGRSESGFYVALGVVGRGPIGAFTVPQMVDTDGDGNKETFIGSTLDGQPHHGFKQTDTSGNFTDSGLGLRQVLGTDPAGDTDYFSLGRVGTTPTSWREVAADGSVYEQNYASGTSFLEIRITQPTNAPVSAIQTHEMQAMISQGLTGLAWSAPGSRSSLSACTNPFWVALNTFLRSLGIDGLDAAAQELKFDVDAAIACAAIADTSVASLFGYGNENKFRFKGTLDTSKPLKDQLRDILNNGLGFFTWSFGKLKLGCRNSATEDTVFGDGNMLFNSLKLSPLKPGFEKLTIEFADEEYLFQKNTVDYTDQDYALRNGRVQNPHASRMGLIGSSTKSQSARIATIRTREELGGITADEQSTARNASWKTTILALDTEAGQVVGISDSDIPGGYGKFRIQSWRLNRDWSIDIDAKTVTDSMYDLTQGTAPADVPTTVQPIQAPVDLGLPPEPIFQARVAADDPTSAELYNLSLATTVNANTVTSGTFTFYYYGSTAVMPTLAASIGPTDTSMDLGSATGISAGTYLLIGSEIVQAGTPSATTTLPGSPTGASVPITRAQLGTVADTHVSGTVYILSALAKSTSFPANFFTSPALATWTFRASLPGMTVVEITGHLTNAYGDGPEYDLACHLVLQAPVLATPSTPSGTSGEDDLYIQPLIGTQDGVNKDFFLDYIPSSEPTGNPPRVPVWIERNERDLSPYWQYSLTPGTNHIQFANPPLPTYKMVAKYFRGGTATPSAPAVPFSTPPPPVGGGASFVNSAIALNTNSISYTATAGNLLVIAVETQFASASGISDTVGDIFSAPVQVAQNPTDSTTVWYVENAVGGATTITTTGGSPTILIVLEYANAPASSALDVQSYGSGLTQSVVTTADTDLLVLVGSFAFAAGVSATASSGFTLREHDYGLFGGTPRSLYTWDSAAGPAGSWSAVVTTSGISVAAVFLLAFRSSPGTGIAFSPGSATMLPDANQSVALEIPVGWIARYTTDGSTPTIGSPQYFSPIPVPAAMTIKAIGIEGDGTTHTGYSASYTIAAPVTPGTDAFSQAIQGFTLLVDDEFGTGGNITDISDLSAKYDAFGIAGAATINQEWEVYQSFSTTNHAFASDRLNLTAVIPGGGGLHAGGINSGQIWSKATYQPGVTGHAVYAFVARVRLPGGVGSWPAFWLYTKQPGVNTDAEIDILEVFNGLGGTIDAHYISSNLHGQVGATSFTLKDGNGYYHPGDDFSAAEHEFACVWTESTVYKYVDGVLIDATAFTWDSGGPAQYGFNLAVGTSNPLQPGLQPTSTGEFPMTYGLLWVKVYGK